MERFLKEGLQALQEAAESHATRFFDVANRSAVYAGRVTLRPKDMGFIRDLRCHSISQCERDREHEWKA